MLARVVWRLRRHAFRIAPRVTFSSKMESAVGSVKPYARHLVVCDGTSAKSWQSHLEMDPNCVVSEYHRVIQAQGVGIKLGDPDKSIRVTLAEEDPAQSAFGASIGAPNQGPSAKHSLIVWPEGKLLQDVSMSDVPDIVEGLASGDASAITSVLSAALDVTTVQVLVCAHASRDGRCGEKGPVLVQNLIDMRESLGATFSVHPCSHIGGHAFAGNCIVYPSGDWFSHCNSLSDAVALVQHTAEEDSGLDFVPDTAAGKLTLKYGRNLVVPHFSGMDMYNIYNHSYLIQLLCSTAAGPHQGRCPS